MYCVPTIIGRQQSNEIAATASAHTKTRQSSRELEENRSKPRNFKNANIVKFSKTIRSLTNYILASLPPNTGIQKPIEEYKDWNSLPSLAEFRRE